MLVSCRATPRSSASAQATDRAGDATAVEHQLVEALVGDAVHVHAHALDQVQEGLARKREAALGLPQADEHEVLAGVGAQRLGRLVKQCAFLGLGQRAVADVVHPPGEGVDGEQRLPLRGGQQAHPVVEVRGLVAGDLRAVPARRVAHPPAARTSTRTIAPSVRRRVGRGRSASTS